MFAKLLKYEWKSNARLLSLLGGCTLGLGCVAAVILRLLTANWDRIIEKDAAVLFMIPAFIFLFVAFFGIMLFAACVQYILLYRFYKSRFTDEGYLMFTLPVKTSHLFLSGAVNLLIWSAISFVVIAISFVIAIVFGPVWPEEVTTELKSALTQMPADMGDILGPGYTLTTLFSFIAMWLYSIVGPMSAVVLGASVAKKHKVLAIIGILIGMSVVTGTASGLISGVYQFLALTTDDIMKIATFTPLLNCIVPLIFTVGGYFLSIHLMEKKLNLP